MRILGRSVAAAGVAFVVLVAGTATVEAQPRAGQAALQWTQASPGRQPAVLDDVDTRAGSTWAVGVDLIDDFADQRPLVMRRQGDKWVVTPQPMKTNSTLTSVAVVDADDVWAVGDDYTDPQAPKPLAMHWNGKAWKVVPAPAVPTGSFGDVAVAADGSVWASGWANVGGQEHAAVYRYVGGAWQALTTGLEDAIRGNTLAVLSAKDVWLGLNGGTGLAHFDGTRWTPVTGVPVSGVPTALQAVGPKDIWMAGVDNSTFPGGSLLMHYDGTAWTRVAAPSGAAQLYDLTIRGGRPVAVGEKFDADLNFEQLVLQYNGTRFVPAPSPTTTAGTLSGVSIAAGRLWAVGLIYATSTELAAYAAHSN